MVTEMLPPQQERDPSLPRTLVKGSALLFQDFFLFYSYQLSSPSPCGAPKPSSSDHEHPTGKSTHRVRAEPPSHTSHPRIFTLMALTLTSGSPPGYPTLNASIHSMPRYLCCHGGCCCRLISTSTHCHAAAAAPWGSRNHSTMAKLLGHAANMVRCQCVLLIFFSFESSSVIKCWKSPNFPRNSVAGKRMGTFDRNHFGCQRL